MEEETQMLQNEIVRLQKENGDLLTRYFSETSLDPFHFICCPSIPDHKVISDYAEYILLLFLCM